MNNNGFPECGFGLILAMHFKHRAQDTAGLNHMIGQSKMFQIIYPCFFKPSNIVGMMHHPHLVSFIILYFVLITVYFHFKASILDRVTESQSGTVS